jgi:subtilisin family serine protease
LILFVANDVPSSAAKAIKAAGGSLVASFPEIGIGVARSASPAFLSAVGAMAGVDSVAPTQGAALSSLPTKFPNRKLPKPKLPPSAGEPLLPMQWNLSQIHAQEAHALQQGKKSVVVAVLDSGIDDTLPDLKEQVDRSRSVSCVGGVPNKDPKSYTFDEIGHGSHVAGIIAAKRNALGTLGVAPGVSLAAVQVTNDGMVYPEAFVCGLHWAATHGAKVVNASLFTDPWYYNCPSDPVQRVLIRAEQRAVAFAISKGVTIVAAVGNEQQDLAHPALDPFSPTNGTSLNRAVDATCKVLPVGLDGVIGVSALAADRQLAFYSNYGLGTVDFAAPGGDFNVPVAGNASGQILGPVPAYSLYYQAAINWNGRVAVGCTDGKDANDPASDPATCAETYALLQGTSQATPHVSAVAALALSQFGNLPPGALLARLKASSAQVGCPAGAYQPYPDVMEPSFCEGAASGNGFFGAGQVDALAAVR